jgi:hypothetical protein
MQTDNTETIITRYTTRSTSAHSFRLWSCDLWHRVVQQMALGIQTIE